MSALNPVIVQFIHPGPEHRIRPREAQQGTFHWSTNLQHARKFLRGHGGIRETAWGPERTTELVFWGEWEAPSAFQRLATPWYSGGLPTYVHAPFLPPDEPQGWHQNTDPLVFGKAFRYTNCKQITHAGRPTRLHNLPLGSLILFGSPLKNPARFVLDTVMVIDGAESPQAVGRTPYGEDLLTDVAYRPVANGSDEWNLTTYTGRRPTSREEPFSFLPALPVHSTPPWFARPVLEPRGVLAEFIVPAKPQGQIIRTAAPDQVDAVWRETVRQVTEEHDLCLATTVDPPPRRTRD